MQPQRAGRQSQACQSEDRIIVVISILSIQTCSSVKMASFEPQHSHSLQICEEKAVTRVRKFNLQNVADYKLRRIRSLLPKALTTTIFR